MSTALDDFADLMQALSPAVGAIVRMGRTDQYVWWLDCDNGALIELEWFDDSSEVMLTTMLGPMLGADELAMCARLLQANLLHCRQGLPRLALSACDGEPLMLRGLPSAGLTLAALAAAVQQLLLESAPWRDILASAAGGSGHALAPPALALLA
jgi:hypothetical protein